MPLLHHQENGRAGSSREIRRSLADFVNFDSFQFSEAGAQMTNHANESDRSWRWESPSSPQAAQTPRSLVPAACFPPRHSSAFSSHSENARPGSWSDVPSGRGISELVASLESLVMPDQAAHSSRTPQGPHRTRLACELLVESPWPPEGAQSQSQSRENGEESRVLSRRASFCGAVGVACGNSVLRWSGTLAARGRHATGEWSPKVFLGGLPWDISEQSLTHALRHYQPVRVEWPGRVASSAPRGFAYVTLESERRVRALLGASRCDRGDWYFRIASRTLRSKEVQVIPWAVGDSNWVCAEGAGAAEGSVRLEPTRTVFVGALHGMLSASALATIMNDLFSGVVYAGIDTDKTKYPIGSGRVAFNNVHSYLRAIAAAYVEVRTDKFTKKIQVDPYLEDSMCSVCNLQQGPYFCREPVCFRYFCRSCWAWQHSADEQGHRPLMRSSKITLAGGQAAAARSSQRGAFNGGDGTPPTPPGIEDAAPEWPLASSSPLLD